MFKFELVRHGHRDEVTAETWEDYVRAVTLLYGNEFELPLLIETGALADGGCSVKLGLRPAVQDDDDDDAQDPDDAADNPMWFEDAFQDSPDWIKALASAGITVRPDRIRWTAAGDSVPVLRFEVDPPGVEA